MPDGANLVRDGFQRQMKIDATGYMGEKTYNALRSALIPDGLAHAGEHGMDKTAVDLLESYAKKQAGPDTRCKLSEHFVVEEFDCHDGTKVASREYDGLTALCNIYLEPLRNKYGSVHINSGFRTPRSVTPPSQLPPRPFASPGAILTGRSDRIACGRSTCAGQTR